MKIKALCLLILCLCGMPLAQAQIKNFQHIIVVFQENRTPDNLFHGLCTAPFGSSSSCSTHPTGSQYNIQTSNWLDNTSSTKTTNPGTVALNNAYDLSHIHKGFTAMCDKNSAGACRMDGAAGVTCSGTCVSKPQFKYVSNTNSILSPYLTLATQYGWANYMFQTNQGPSFPAHQFIFGGTSAPSADDDANGIFAMDNVHQVAPGAYAIHGCIALEGSYVTLITPDSQNQRIFPCFEHATLSDLLDTVGVSWKYYTPSTTSLWTAPNSIQHICVPDAATGGTCTGSDFTKNVVINPSHVLTDIANCNLPGVSWVIPDGKNSDHAQTNTGGGPSWVASVVNAVGNNPKCANGELYWNNTAIVITWDDWGGWYDHEPPTILPGVQGDYQYGFRVPLIVVSAYTQAAYVNNNRLDFGTILRFIEKNFGITRGSLNFADARTTGDLALFFKLNQVPRIFQTIPAKLSADFFIHDTSPATDPDDD